MKGIIKKFFIIVLIILLTCLILFILNKTIGYNKAIHSILDAFSFYTLAFYYTIPFFGWFFIIPLVGSIYLLIKTKLFKSKLIYLFISIIFLLIIIYFFWWWISKQEFIFL